MVSVYRKKQTFNDRLFGSMRLSAASRCISYKRGHSGSGYHGTHRAASSMSVFTGLLGLPDRPWHWS